MAKGIRSIWIDSDSVGVLGTKIYRDDVLIATVPFGTLEYKDPTVEVDVEYKYVTQAYTSTSESTDETLGVNMGYYTIQSEVPGTGLTPLMTNFSIESGQPTRIYFDSNKPITGTSVAGWRLGNNSGPDFTSITIQSGLTTGHYFTLDTALSHYDNWAIRFEGGGDIQDLDGNGIFKMLLTYVENNIPEPDASSNKFVTNTASGGDGSEGSPWTLAEAGANASGGDTVWIKQGDYGNVTLTIANSGTDVNPIKFIGYTNDWTNGGDINTPMTDSFVYTTNANARAFVDDSVYPVINGANSGSTVGININDQYVIFKNICIMDQPYSIRLYDAADAIIFDNCLVGDCWNTTTDEGRGWDADFGASRVRLINCIAFDGELNNFSVDGTNNLLDNCNASSGTSGNAGRENGTDYYISNNHFVSGIVRRCIALRTRLDAHKGHGIGAKAHTQDGGATLGYVNNSLYELNSVTGMDEESLFIAYPRSTYNVFKNNTVEGEVEDSTGGDGMVARDAANYNVFDSNYVKTGSQGIYLLDEGEAGNVGTGNYNTFSNNIIDNFTYGIRALDVNGNTSTYSGNIIVNNTFSNCVTFIRANATDDGTNIIQNNIIYNIGNHYSTNGIVDDITEEYNNYWGGFAKPAGTGNISVDPQFIDTTDYVPQNDALIVAPRLTGVEMDINNDERLETTTIGAVKNPNEIPELI